MSDNLQDDITDLFDDAEPLSMRGAATQSTGDHPDDVATGASNSTGIDETGPETRAWTRRLFRYLEHEIEDPGAEYSIEEVRQGLVPYFEDLVSATHQEEVHPDGTLVVTFRKRTTHKGSDVRTIAEALGRLLPEPLSDGAHQPVLPTLAILGDVLEHAELLLSLSEEQENRTEELASAIQRCTALQPIPLLSCLPLGF